LADLQESHDESSESGGPEAYIEQFKEMCREVARKHGLQFGDYAKAAE